jgi:hypothetical protein
LEKVKVLNQSDNILVWKMVYEDYEIKYFIFYMNDGKVEIFCETEYSPDEIKFLLEQKNRKIN